MRFTLLNRDELDEKKLPDSIYKSVVTSLYSDPKSLAIGIICCILVSVVLFYKTLDPTQLIFAGLFFFIGAARIFLTLSFNKVVDKGLSVQAYKAWENKYIFAGSVYLSVLGAWYINGLISNDDPYVQLASLALILCYLAGIIGRNFASYKVVRAQVIIAILFLIGGSLVFDKAHGMYSVLLSFFLLPYLIATYKMSASLRGMLFKAEINALNNSMIANRFDAALENVTHGIAMIDKNGVVVVANDRFVQLSGMVDWEIVGCNIEILNTIEIRNTLYKTLGEQIRSCLEDNKSVQVIFEMTSGATIEAEYNSMIDGGVIALSDISERRASEKVIKDLANFDALTNLPNRRYFMETVEKFFKADQVSLVSSMYFVDLDKFKEINDTLGHAIGDELLRVVANRLKLILDKDMMLCRFGGDEFIIFCPTLNDPTQCSNFADKILKEIHSPIVMQNHNFDITGSVGISISPEHGTDVDVLIQHADAALYESKAKGRSMFTFYTNSIGEAISEKRQLEIDLRQALKSDELTLFYQPIFDVKKCAISSCEALARWNHPKLGFVSPNIFIEMAEETGLIVELGEKLLRKAMRDCLMWPSEICVAVNVSSIQFQKTDIFHTVTTLLSETGLPANRLIIEVTESVMIGDIDDIKKTLSQLSNLGVSISLDDFGTGFSSLSYLHTLLFDKVKIDKSFVDNSVESDRSLVLLQGVVDLLKRLGLRIVLEGIETQEQLDIMENNIFIHEYQGYLFFKPMNTEDFIVLADKTIASLSRDNIAKLALQ